MSLCFCAYGGQIGEAGTKFRGNYSCAATTVCMYFAHLGLHGPYWDRGTKFGGGGELSFGVIVSGVDGCIFKRGY